MTASPAGHRACEGGTISYLFLYRQGPDQGLAFFHKLNTYVYTHPNTQRELKSYSRTCLFNTKNNRGKKRHQIHRKQTDLARYKSYFMNYFTCKLNI